MLRALWTASSGMQAQQLSVDTIANNLANVNTTGFKKARAEFQDLFYATVRGPGATTAAGMTSPVGIQIGHGVRSVAVSRDFTTGNLEQTGNTFDFAIEGNGFFAVLTPNGIAFTRDGAFKLQQNEDGDLQLVTADGYAVLSQDGGELGDPIVIPVDATDISIGENGVIRGITPDSDGQEELSRIAIAVFTNPAGLSNIGRNLLAKTGASGEETYYEDPDIGETIPRGRVMSGFLELSNVQVVEEMVKLITAQRAYEINSKAIQTSDEMLGLANNLRR